MILLPNLLNILFQGRVFGSFCSYFDLYCLYLLIVNHIWDIICFGCLINAGFVKVCFTDESELDHHFRGLSLTYLKLICFSFQFNQLCFHRVYGLVACLKFPCSLFLSFSFTCSVYLICLSLMFRCTTSITMIFLSSMRRLRIFLQSILAAIVPRSRFIRVFTRSVVIILFYMACYLSSFGVYYSSNSYWGYLNNCYCGYLDKFYRGCLKNV